MKYGYFIILVSILFIASCEMVEYSPNVAFDTNSPEIINEKNIEKLLSKPNPDDTIRIIFTGDSQGFYDEAEGLVEKANSIENVDFLIHSGDISDFGLLQEFEWVDLIFSRLKMPYISVVGNHDLLGKGRDVYKYMYGEEDFSFVYDSVKFIFHNTNSREFNFSGKVPDLDFLRRELSPSPGVEAFVAVSHVPPFDVDFDEKLEQSYARLFSECEQFMVSLHGHWHNTTDLIPYEDGVRYINSNSVSKKEFLLLEIVNDTLIKTFVPY